MLVTEQLPDGGLLPHTVEVLIAVGEQVKYQLT